MIRWMTITASTPCTPDRSAVSSDIVRSENRKSVHTIDARFNEPERIAHAFTRRIGLLIKCRWPQGADIIYGVYRIRTECPRTCNNVGDMRYGEGDRVNTAFRAYGKPKRATGSFSVSNPVCAVIRTVKRSSQIYSIIIIIVLVGVFD